MKQIPLTKDKYVLVDDDVFDQLNANKWCFNGGYAKRALPWKDGKRPFVYMHRIILNAPEDMFVDHIDGNTLDNRKANLRLCTRAQNARNTPPRSCNFKGVGWAKHRNKWFVRICTSEGKNKYIGYFTDEIEAAKAYNKAAKHYYGEFAWLNKV